MRKATIYFLMLLSSATAFAQDEPQWKVVQHVVLFNQNKSIPYTSLLTPTEPGIYRLTLYFSGPGKRGSTGTFTESLIGTDLSGKQLSTYASYVLDCGEIYWQPIPPITISLKPNLSLGYQVYGVPGSPCEYNLAITLEQLM